MLVRLSRSDQPFTIVEYGRTKLVFADARAARQLDVRT
jgi:hypothetical protein